MKKNKVRILLQVSCLFLFIGYGCLHILGMVPYRAFFWSETLNGLLISNISNFTWFDFVTSDAVDRGIQFFIASVGVLFLLLCLVVLRTVKNFKKIDILLVVGSFFIFIAAYLNFIESNYQVAMLFEFSAQIAAPLFLLTYRKNYYEHPYFILALKTIVAITFTCHGLYALGVYPVPGHFIDMTIEILNVSEPIARNFLKIAGIIDLVISVAIFVPRINKYAFVYAAFWGLATLVARPLAMISSFSETISLLHWMLEAFYRVPHAALPLVGYLIVRHQSHSQLQSQLVDSDLTAIAFENY